MQNDTCKKLCDAKNYTSGDPAAENKLKLLKNGMAYNYQHHWIVGERSINFYKFVNTILVIIN